MRIIPRESQPNNSHKLDLYKLFDQASFVMMGLVLAVCFGIMLYLPAESLVLEEISRFIAHWG